MRWSGIKIARKESILREMADQEKRGKGGEGGKGGSLIPAKKKSVKQMIAEKIVESSSKVFKDDKKKIKPRDDEDND